MDINKAITVTKFHTQNGHCYIVAGWQPYSFEMYIYSNREVWKGHFSHSRLTAFAKNLNMSEDTYFQSVKRCISKQRTNYRYELKSGFFYWKRKTMNTVVIEGFLPVEHATDSTGQPDLVDVLLTLNKHLKEKLNKAQSKFNTVKVDYQKCLRDTEQFLNLKVEMEKALCDKFLNLLAIKNNLEQNSIKQEETKSLEQRAGDTTNL